MKKLVLTMSLMIATTASAAEYQELVLKENVILTPTQLRDGSNVTKFTAEKGGSTYCVFEVTANDPQAPLMTVPAGTVFDVSEVNRLSGPDWGKAYRLEVKAANPSVDARAYLVCKSRGAFAQQVSAKKVNKLLGDFVELK